MKKYICALFIIFTYTLYSQQIPFNVAFENLNFNNKQNIYFTESDTFIYNLKNGVIDDDFIYSDTNGVKVSGRYKSVSYTHLILKHTLYSGYIEYKKGTHILKEIPVSYTHLDVYKRQVIYSDTKFIKVSRALK